MSNFAQRNGLRPADVVIVPKSEWNIIDHYIVYLGTFNYVEYYAENNRYLGVREFTGEQFINENPTYKRFQLFKGSDNQRYLAVQRARTLMGRKYDLAKFNCEHYANYVQNCNSESSQVNNFAKVATGTLMGVTLVGLLIAAFSGE